MDPDSLPCAWLSLVNDEGVSGHVTEVSPLGRGEDRHEGDQVGGQPVDEPEERSHGRGLGRDPSAALALVVGVAASPAAGAVKP